MVSSEHTVIENTETTQSVDQFLEVCEQKLDEAGKINATQAFNLGCTIALIPAGIIVLIAYIATRTWLAALLTGVLMIIAVIGFANLSALTARTKTMERIFSNEVAPDISTYLQATGLARADFENKAWENLPPTAHLLQFIPKPIGIEPPKKHWTTRFNLRRKK